MTRLDALRNLATVDPARNIDYPKNMDLAYGGSGSEGPQCAGLKPFMNEQHVLAENKRILANMLGARTAEAVAPKSMPNAVNPNANEPEPPSPDDIFADALANQWRAIHDIESARLQYQAERRRIASILATFAASPISASSLQPILDLAAEMNQEAK